MQAACVSSLMEPSVSASGAAPRLAWKWILEKLVDLPDFGVAFINEVITTHVTDIEEPHCRPLLERIALRNLEEMVVTNQIDSDAIPLLKALTGQDLGPVTIASSVKQRFNRELVLRVQTEVVLSVLRKDMDEEEKDWAFYELELERVFGEAEDNRLLDRKRELCALLKPKNQTKPIVAAYFENYSLNKLRNDLYSFIDEKRESFKTMFLDQLSHDFLDANGTPFPEELGDVEKCTEGNANAKEGHVGTANVESMQPLTSTHIKEDMNLQEVGQNLKLDETGSQHDVNETGDQHIVLGTSTVSSKKRLRRKLLPTQDGIDDDEPEVQEGNAGIKKSRKVSPTSVINPLKALLHQGASEIAMFRFGPQSGCFPARHGVESLKQLSSLRRGEEAVSAPRNFGSKVTRCCSPPVHASNVMEGAKVPPREPSRTNKYVILSDVESDAETQVVKRLSTHDEDDSIENCEDDDHQKKGDQVLSESGSDRGHSEKIVATEVVKKETIIVQSERKVMVDREKETLTASPEVKISQQADNEKFVTKNGSILQDTQDMYEVDFLEVGTDGHEDVCHICGLHGKLHCCDGCAISMHFKCIEALGLRLPTSEDDWYCPVCLSLKAAREAVEAEKAAAAAKEKLKAFQEGIKRRSSCEGNSLHHHPKQEKAVKQSRLRVSSLQSEEPARAKKPQQQSEDEPKLGYTEGRQESVPPKASLLPTILRRALHQLKQLGEQDAEDKGEDSLPENQFQSKRVTPFGQGEGGKNLNDVGGAQRVDERLVNTSPKSLLKNGAGIVRVLVSGVEDVRKPHKIHPSHDQGVLRRNPLAASTSGLVKKEKEPVARFLKKKGLEFDSGEESAEQEADGPEPGSGASGRGEVGGDRDDEDLNEDLVEKSEHLNRSPVFSCRRKLPGLRRTPLPWTREEEHALKEGVKRFSHDGSWGFQWKRILEFGQGRFDPSRTDVDLKDKWRNLVKGVSYL